MLIFMWQANSGVAPPAAGGDDLAWWYKRRRMIRARQKRIKGPRKK